MEDGKETDSSSSDSADTEPDMEPADSKLVIYTQKTHSGNAGPRQDDSLSKLFSTKKVFERLKVTAPSERHGNLGVSHDYAD